MNILEYQIFKRDQLHAEKKKKEAAVISTPPPAEEKTSKETINFGDIDLADVNDAVQLEHYGMEHLKWLLETRGLKCGGNLQERCRRLLMTKGKLRFNPTCKLTLSLRTRARSIPEKNSCQEVIYFLFLF